MNKRRIISFLMACVLCTSFVTPIFAAEQEHIVYIDSTEDFFWNLQETVHRIPGRKAKNSDSQETLTFQERILSPYQPLAAYLMDRVIPYKGGRFLTIFQILDYSASFRRVLL